MTSSPSLDKMVAALLSNMRVEIVEAHLHSDKSGEFMVYHLKSSMTSPNAWDVEGDNVVFRRFSEFEHLRAFLVKKHPSVVVPPLPEKKVNFSLSKFRVDKSDAQFVSQRKHALQTFVRNLLLHPTLVGEDAVKSFVTSGDWKDTLVIEKDGVNVFFQLENIEYTVRSKHPDPRFVTINDYATAFSDHIMTLFANHEKICNKLQQLAQIYNGAATVLHEWAEVETLLGARLGEIRREFDQLSVLVETEAEAEQLNFTFPMKEFSTYADSLREVVRAQERLQHDAMNLMASLESKKRSLASLEKSGSEGGMAGFFSKLTSGGDVEGKKQQYRAQITELQQQFTDADVKNKEFCDAALADMDRFHKDKRRHLAQLFIVHARLQKMFCEANMKLWQGIASKCLQ